VTYEQPHLSFEAVFSFSGAGLYLAGAVLGRNIELHLDAARVTISLPKPDEVFSPVDDPGRGRRALQAHGTSEGETLAATVSEFEVRVQVIRQGDEPFSALFTRAFPVALETVELFIAWMRTRAGQYWLPAWHEVLDSTRPSHAKLVVAGTDEVVADPAATWVPGVRLFGRSLEQAVRPEVIEDVVSKLGANAEPPGENVLLADAQAVLRNPQSARRDTVHAVLLTGLRPSPTRRVGPPLLSWSVGRAW